MQDEAVRRQDAILRAVGFAAEQFLRERNIADALPEVLAQIGEAAGVSRVTVHDLGTDEQGELTCTLRHEWSGPAIRPFIDDPSEKDFPLVAGGYGRWIDILGEGDVLQGLRDSFPESEREFLENEGVLSILAIPVFLDDTWWGWIGFDDCETERIWAPVEIDALRAAAGLLSAAIQRERADRRRSEAEAKYQALVEQLPAIVFIESHESEPRTLYVSPQIKDLYGYSAAEWLRTPGIWRQVIHPDDREATIAQAERTQVAGEPFHAEYRVINRFGKELWVLEEATLVRDEAGEPRFWQGIVLDITEQKQMRSQLDAAEARFRSLVEQVPAAIYTESIETDQISGPILYASPQIERFLGHSAEEWMANPDLWLETIHPDDRERVREHAEHVTETGDPFLIEYRFCPDEETTYWVRDQAEMVRDEAGEPLLWQGFIFDITDRKAAETRLEEAEELYRALVERTPVVLYIDVPGETYETTYISPQVEQMLGVTPEAWVADRLMWHGLVHPDDRDRVVKEYEECMRAGRSMDQEYRIVRPDGREVWIEDRFSVIRDATTGEPKLIQGLMMDVTEKRRADSLEHELLVERETGQRLRDIDEMKNTFLTAVSHDLRTPLAAILGLAVTLERDDLGLVAEDGKDLVKRVADNARKLDRLVTDLLDLDRLTRGILEPKRHPTDVGALVRKVVDEAEFLPDHPVTVQAESVVLSVDGAKIERIVENLLANTARHTPKGTEVWVVVRPMDDGVTIAVEDAGPGISANLRDSVFEPFRQAGQDQGDPSPGVGIGLSLVARFSELHGGRAWVEEREGGGASFRVFIPPAGRTHFR